MYQSTVPYLVAEVGFEPHDLRVMSPTSYQAALLRDMMFLSLDGAGDRDRTGTILTYHGILSPGRLPVPPHRQGSTERLLRSCIGSHCLLYHIHLGLSTPFLYFPKKIKLFCHFFKNQRKSKFILKNKIFFSKKA